ncbi:uncharacterized protein LOC141855729 [Brevipalpus obovatus]|uniref:uncharacterized protein LOC141855729 n=1 Tax=Brevipalpus obovatus TaxID=246614 RepID=UPI003D9F09A7
MIASLGRAMAQNFQIDLPPSATISETTSSSKSSSSPITSNDQSKSSYGPRVVDTTTIVDDDTFDVRSSMSTPCSLDLYDYQGDDEVDFVNREVMTMNHSSDNLHRARSMSTSSSTSTTVADSDYDTCARSDISENSDTSETSTLSPSPIREMDYPPLDEALLEEKFSKLGFSKYTIHPPTIRLRDANNNNNDFKLSISDSSESLGGQDGDGDDDGTDSDDQYGRAPFLRSTSLKTGKTPPNTPGRGKKVVRFADALGLEFEYVKFIKDEIPNVPKSAFQDLKVPDDTLNRNINSFNYDKHESPTRTQRKLSRDNQMVDTIDSSLNVTLMSDSFQQPYVLPSQRARKISPLLNNMYNQAQKFTLIPEFLQPCASTGFCDRVRSQAVCLENCIVSSGAGNLSVTCVIRVLNIAYEKEVTVRHTLTEWSSTTDSLASYLPNSCDSWSDKFSVTFSIRSHAPGGSLQLGQRVLFAIRYVANGVQYWDNNMGLNYSLIYKSF